MEACGSMAEPLLGLSTAARYAFSVLQMSRCGITILIEGSMRGQFRGPHYHHNTQAIHSSRRRISSSSGSAPLHWMSVLAPSFKSQCGDGGLCDKSPQHLIALLKNTITSAASYFATHAEIEGSSGLLKKMRADLSSIEHQHSPDNTAAEDSAMAAASYQGVTNNLRGFLGELEAVQVQACAYVLTYIVGCIDACDPHVTPASAYVEHNLLVASMPAIPTALQPAGLTEEQCTFDALPLCSPDTWPAVDHSQLPEIKSLPPWLGVAQSLCTLFLHPFLQHAPGVVAVCKKFRSVPCCAPPPPDAASAAQRRAALNQRIAQKQQLKQKQQQQQQKRELLQGQVPTQLPAAELDQGPQEGQLELSQHNAQGEGFLKRAPGQSVHKLGLRQDKQQQQQQQEQQEQKQEQQQQQQPLTVEVDVVACEGSCWVEVKAQEAYGIESPHWERKEGSSGHGKVSV
eukprot:1144077-Pelagomonas_calceolata.AAC.11